MPDRVHSNKKSKRYTKPKIILFFVLGLISLFILFICGLLIGSEYIPPVLSLRVILKAAFGFGDVSDMGQTFELYRVIIFTLRMPRVISCLLVGACLSLAGACMQGLLKNPLADGTVMGVSSGASAGAVLAIVLISSAPAVANIGVFAFAAVFAFASLLIVITVARIIDRNLSSNTVILVGVVFSMFAGSVTGLLTVFSGDQLKNIVFWSMGSMQRSSFKTIYILTPVAIVSLVFLLRYNRELNAFGMGEDEARYSGVNVRRVKLSLMAVVSLLVGVTVAACGNIAFVGLIVPHIARRIVGPGHSRLLPAACIGGAAFLLIADIIARSIMPPLELPIGIVTSAVGAVFFLSIFFIRRNKAA